MRGEVKKKREREREREKYREKEKQKEEKKLKIEEREDKRVCWIKEEGHSCSNKETCMDTNSNVLLVLIILFCKALMVPIQEGLISKAPC